MSAETKLHLPDKWQPPPESWPGVWKWDDVWTELAAVVPFEVKKPKPIKFNGIELVQKDGIYVPKHETATSILAKNNEASLTIKTISTKWSEQDFYDKLFAASYEKMVAKHLKDDAELYGSYAKTNWFTEYKHELYSLPKHLVDYEFHSLPASTSQRHATWRVYIPTNQLLTSATLQHPKIYKVDSMTFELVLWESFVDFHFPRLTDRPTYIQETLCTAIDFSTRPLPSF